MRLQLLVLIVGAITLIVIFCVIGRVDDVTPLEPQIVAHAVDDEPDLRPGADLDDPSAHADSRKSLYHAEPVSRFLAHANNVWFAGRAFDESGAPIQGGADVTAFWIDVYLRHTDASGKEVTLMTASRRIQIRNEGGFRAFVGLQRDGDEWQSWDTCPTPHAQIVGPLGHDAYLAVCLRRRLNPSSGVPPYDRGGKLIGRLHEKTDELELGDMMVERWPPLVAGRVIDTLDRPVANAWVSVVLPRGQPNHQVWRPLEPLGFARNDGTFQIESEEIPDTLRLVVGADGFETEVIPNVLPYSRNVLVELRMHSTGQVQGSIAFDPQLKFSDLQVGLRDLYGGITTIVPADDGTFKFSSTLIGYYSLEVQTRGTGFVLDSVADVFLPPDQPHMDPRLDSLDVRDKWLRIEARLVRSREGPFAFQRVRVEDENGGGGVIVTDERGEVSALAPRDTFRLFAMAPGHPRQPFLQNDTIVLRTE